MKTRESLSFTSAEPLLAIPYREKHVKLGNTLPALLSVMLVFVFEPAVEPVPHDKLRAPSHQAGRHLQKGKDLPQSLSLPHSSAPKALEQARSIFTSNMQVATGGERWWWPSWAALPVTRGGSHVAHGGGLTPPIILVAFLAGFRVPTLLTGTGMTPLSPGDASPGPQCHGATQSSDNSPCVAHRARRPTKLRVVAPKLGSSAGDARKPRKPKKVETPFPPPTRQVPFAHPQGETFPSGHRSPPKIIKKGTRTPQTRGSLLRLGTAGVCGEGGEGLGGSLTSRVPPRGSSAPRGRCRRPHKGGAAPPARPRHAGQPLTLSMEPGSRRSRRRQSTTPSFREDCRKASGSATVFLGDSSTPRAISHVTVCSAEVMAAEARRRMRRRMMRMMMMGRGGVIFRGRGGGFKRMPPPPPCECR